MEAVEFIRKIQKMCAGTDCDVCPLNAKNGCNVCYAEDPMESVRIVEEWAAEQERQKAEQEDIEGAISSNKTRIEKIEYDVSVIRHNLAVLDDRIYALREKVDHTLTMESGQTPEQKRTNRDVLLAAFPNARMDNNGIPNVCPLALDTQYDCNAFASCSLCKRTHWSAEVEE